MAKSFALCLLVISLSLGCISYSVEKDTPGDTLYGVKHTSFLWVFNTATNVRCTELPDSRVVMCESLEFVEAEAETEDIVSPRVLNNPCEDSKECSERGACSTLLWTEDGPMTLSGCRGDTHCLPDRSRKFTSFRYKCVRKDE